MSAQVQDEGLLSTDTKLERHPCTDFGQLLSVRFVMFSRVLMIFHRATKQQNDVFWGDTPANMGADTGNIKDIRQEQAGGRHA